MLWDQRLFICDNKMSCARRAEIFIDGVEDEDAWPQIRDEVVTPDTIDDLNFILFVNRRPYSPGLSGNPVRSTIVGMIRNEDVPSSHLYTLQIDAQYVQAASTGRFR